MKGIRDSNELHKAKPKENEVSQNKVH